RRGPEQVHPEQDTLALRPIGESRTGEDAECRGEHADEPEQADGGRAADAVGVDRERHEARPLRDVETAPGELETPQLGAPEHVAERLEARDEATQRLSHSARIPDSRRLSIVSRPAVPERPAGARAPAAAA